MTRPCLLVREYASNSLPRLHLASPRRDNHLAAAMKASQNNSERLPQPLPAELQDSAWPGGGSVRILYPIHQHSS